MKRLLNLLNLLSLLTVVLLTVTLPSFAVSPPDAHQGLPWRRFDAGLNEAVKSQKVILLQVYADWCHECHHIEMDILGDVTLRRLVQDKFVPVRVNLQSQQSVKYQGESMSEEQLTRRLRIPGPPVMLVLDPGGKQLGRLVGYRPPEQVQNFLSQMLNRYLQKP